MQQPFRFLLTISTLVFFTACQESTHSPATGFSSADSVTIGAEKNTIAALLDSFNRAAARADYATYFSYYTDDATFNGTDATENWNKQAFMTWAKPYFDNKTTWDFTSLQRSIYLSDAGDFAWFDELLSTQMKLCRGSGVLRKIKNEWKIQQYVLSMTIPNQLVDPVVALKTPLEDSLMLQLKK